MAGHGGYREGSGRKPTLSRTVRVREKLLQRAMDGSQPTPLDFLWSVAMNKALELGIRVDAAKAVCPYLFPRLQSVQVSNDDSNRLTIVLQSFSRKEAQDVVAEQIHNAIEHKQTVDHAVIEAITSDDDG